MERIEDNFLLDEIIARALMEDRAFNDITTRSTVSPDKKSSAFIIAKQDFILSGVIIFVRCFKLLDPDIKLFSPFSNGSEITRGDKIFTINGSTAAILSAERVALNFLSHLSGIATYTRNMVRKLEGTTIKLLDTRKTLPGLRVLEKWAFKHGGGHNHRYNLESGIMIKDNHIAATGSISCAIKSIRESVPPSYTIEVEVNNMPEAKEAIENKADIILIDNLSGKELADIVEFAHGKVLIEVSGGINLNNIEDYKSLKIDFISSSSPIMKSCSADISLLIDSIL